LKKYFPNYSTDEGRYVHRTETPANMMDVNIDTGLLIRTGPVVNMEKWSLEMLSTLVESSAFSGEEQRKLTASLKRQASDAKRIRFAYDITAVCDSEHMKGSSDECPPEGTIRLSSSNFGYDFVLVKAQAGPGLFGKPRHVVQIYRSRLGENNYSCLQMTTSLAKALSLIDRMYCQAAELHFP
jgi:hypothetical protein